MADSTRSGRSPSPSRSPRPSRQAPRQTPSRTGLGGPGGPGGPGVLGVLGVPLSAIHRGRARLALIRDLAMGEWSPQHLAKQMGLPTEDILEFKDRYEDEIQEVRSALAGQLAIETAGLWITKKQNRIAEYQQIADDIGDALAHLRRQSEEDDKVNWSRAHREMNRQRMDVFRAVADELGAYPQRQSAPARSGTTVHYVIETDSTDLEALT